MKIEEKMTTDIHNGDNRGSVKDHSRRKVEKEDAKENGIQRQLSEEEYEREKVKIAVHLEILMKMLQINKEDQRNGCVMRKKVKWQRLQEKRNQQVNMQLAEELMKLEQVMNVKLKSKELREAELKMDISICEVEQGEFLGEDED